MSLLFTFLLVTSLNLNLGVPWLRILKQSWECNTWRWIIHPMHVTGQRLPVNIAPPTRGEISIFRSLWMKCYGVIIYLIKPIQQELLLCRILLYLILIRCVSNFWMNCSLSFSAKAQKRPTGAGKRGLFSEEELPESKRPRVSPAPFSGGLGEGSGTSSQF